MAEPFDTVFADLVRAVTLLTAVDQGVTEIINVLTQQLTEAASMAWDLGATSEETQPYVDLASALEAQSASLAAAVQANTPAETGPSAVTAPASRAPQPARTARLADDKGWPTTGENPNPPEQPVDQNAPDAGQPPPPDTIPDEGELDPDHKVEGEEEAPDGEETSEARKARLEHNLARRRERWSMLHRPKTVVQDPNALPPGYQPTDRGPLTDDEAHGDKPIQNPAWPGPYGAPPERQPAAAEYQPPTQEAEGEEEEPDPENPDKPRRRRRHG